MKKSILEGSKSNILSFLSIRIVFLVIIVLAGGVGHVTIILTSYAQECDPNSGNCNDTGGGTTSGESGGGITSGESGGGTTSGESGGGTTSGESGGGTTSGESGGGTTSG